MKPDTTVPVNEPEDKIAPATMKISPPVTATDIDPSKPSDQPEHDTPPVETGSIPITTTITTADDKIPPPLSKLADKTPPEPMEVCPPVTPTDIENPPSKPSDQTELETPPAETSTTTTKLADEAPTESMEISPPENPTPSSETKENTPSASMEISTPEEDESTELKLPPALQHPNPLVVPTFLSEMANSSLLPSFSPTLPTIETLGVDMRAHLLSIVSNTANNKEEEHKMQEDTPPAPTKVLETYILYCLNFCLHISTIHNETTTLEITKLPYVLLEDAYDILPFSKVQTLFQSLLIPNVKLWSHPHLFRKFPKLILIRVCNKLLKKKGDAFGFGGEVLMMLSAIYPLSERSATNLQGNFNVENVTLYEKEGDFLEGQGHIGGYVEETMKKEAKRDRSGDDANVWLNYQFYKKFWGLQSYFSNPKRILEQKNDVFVETLGEVLGVFESLPVRAATTATAGENSPAAGPVGGSENHHFKYLTCSELLPYQIHDAELRLEFLTQVMIVISHLRYLHQKSISVASGQDQIQKPKGSAWCSPDQMKVLETISKRVQKLMENTPQNGAKHYNAMDWILKEREVLWRKWKADKCPPINKIRKALKDNIKTNKPTTTRQTIKTPKKMVSPYEYSIGPLKSPIADNTIPVTDYLQEYAEALDPDAGIEEEYHPKNNTMYCFRALRSLWKDHILDFHLVRPKNGDFENLVRNVWLGEKGKELPGNFVESEDEEEEGGVDLVDDDDASVGSPFLEDEEEEENGQKEAEIIEEDADEKEEGSSGEVQKEQNTHVDIDRKKNAAANKKGELTHTEDETAKVKNTQLSLAKKEKEKETELDNCNKNIEHVKEEKVEATQQRKSEDKQTDEKRNTKTVKIEGGKSKEVSQTKEGKTRENTRSDAKNTFGSSAPASKDKQSRSSSPKQNTDRKSQSTSKPPPQTRSESSSSKQQSAHPTTKSTQSSGYRANSSNKNQETVREPSSSNNAGRENANNDGGGRDYNRRGNNRSGGGNRRDTDRRNHTKRDRSPERREVGHGDNNDEREGGGGAGGGNNRGGGGSDRGRSSRPRRVGTDRNKRGKWTSGSEKGW